MRTCFYLLDTAKVEKNIEYSSSNSEKEKRKLLFVFLSTKESVLKQRNNPTKSRNNPTKLDFIFLKQRTVFFILFSNSAIGKSTCFCFDFVSLQPDFAETDIRIHLSNTNYK